MDKEEPQLTELAFPIEGFCQEIYSKANSLIVTKIIELKSKYDYLHHEIENQATISYVYNTIAIKLIKESFYLLNNQIQEKVLHLLIKEIYDTLGVVRYDQKKMKEKKLEK